MHRILPLEVIGNRIKTDVMATLKDDESTKLMMSSHRRKNSEKDASLNGDGK